MRIATLEEAQKLYDVLDNIIGVFREKNMPSAGVKFYQKKKADFLEQVMREIPATYWFQGGGCASLTLNFDSTGFYVTSDRDDTRTTNALDKVNTALRKLKLTYL